ncbi:MAG: arginine--tRNA ligase, partial [Gemmiger sp.]|uniref:arginine--tRNA ligase n=1 Tax=Gemmiger sp. TaxID=2049027 RepID=UPI002A813F18
MNYEYYNPRKAALDAARELLTGAAKSAMSAGTLPEAELPDFIVEIPGDVKNGDIASNLAMAGARAFHRAPRQIAQAIVDRLDLTGSPFDRVEIAGPGFINLFLGQAWFTDVLRAACSVAEYGRTRTGEGKRYNVEFVSANPTGPMHMGNARGGALGDCLAACLDWAGYDVTREFYINDAGNQIQKFGKSLAIRYLQLYKGEEAVPLPEECYQGADIVERAKEFAAVHGDSFVDRDFEELKQALIDDALPKNIAGLQRDLGKYRIEYDVWFHESDLHKSGAVDEVIRLLMDKGACYRAEDGAIMYRSAQYAARYGVANRKKTDDGSEEEAKDEVLVRANGIPTYFAADIAYHYNKLKVRGFDRAIDVWGADHHGHVARMKGAMDAVGLDGSRLDVVLMQMVNLMRDGKPVRMSKRTGKAITLTDLLDEVPIDSARFFFNQRESSSTLDFDLDLAVRNDSENPVYYVQYAHARICSVLKK